MSVGAQAPESTMFADSFRGRRVFITGHTGFKGSWLTHWLCTLGARVSGYALNPQPHELLFDQLELASCLDHDFRHDVRDAGKLRDAISACEPEFVFHLAAQPLVRQSFEIPAETFETNVMGTVNLLDAMRQVDRPCVVVIVTTDKCYENREWLHAYREEDAMGGFDPYSASKGCAELVTAAYRQSFFSPHASHVSLASARAGNVIGGGDWATDRIVPDIFRAIFAEQRVPVRNRTATRPWQHVLEPLSGYLWLAACLANPELSPFDLGDLRSAFNFGPSLHSNRTVADVVEAVLKHTGGNWEDRSDPNAPHEASKLNLSIDKAFHMLGWSPTWNFELTIAKTAEWYRQVKQGLKPLDVTTEQIQTYQADANEKKIHWATPSNS
jgi:CDP-glucose 4,6-dehydratase